MKKSIASFLALCILAVSLCGCGANNTQGNSSPPPPAQSTPGQDSPSPERSTKDEIIFAQGSDLTTMDPHIGMQERAFSLTNNIFDPLVTFDPDMNMQPCLATSWEWLENGCVLEMKLREGVKFQNGDDFTAEDVVFNADRLQELNNTFGDAYVKTEAVDEYTVRFYLSAPKPALLNALTDPMCSMIPKDYFESDPDGFAANPIGTGPYKMKDYSVGDYYTLERWDGYWGEPAKTERLTMRIVPESGQRVTLLETGEIDVAYEIPYNSVSMITDNPNLQLLQTPSMKIIMIYCNTQSAGPIGNPTVRKAIESAIDKEAIVQAVCYGYGEATYSIMPSSADDYQELPGNPYNVERAKELLAEAGYADGFDLEIWTNSNQANTELCTILQSQLKEIGVNLKITVQDDNTTNSLRNSGADFGLMLHFFSCNISHADYVLFHTLTSTQYSNFSRFKLQEYDDTYHAWEQTAEGDEREALLQQLYAIEQEYLPEIPVYNDIRLIGATASLEGLALSRIGAYEYQNAVVYTD